VVGEVINYNRKTAGGSPGRGLTSRFNLSRKNTDRTKKRDKINKVYREGG